MSLTTHIGYGPFRLSDFLAGELFARFDSTLARVCDPQPPGRPDHVQVVTDFGTYVVNHISTVMLLSRLCGGDLEFFGKSAASTHPRQHKRGYG